MSRYFRNKKAFTLFEVTLVIALFSIIVVYAFSSLVNLSVLRASIMSRVELEEDLYFFVEQLATTIKEGGSIDYEEYWNRQVVGTGKTMGHYTQFTGFGNYGAGGVFGALTFGNGIYYCASTDGVYRLGTNGCLSSYNYYNLSTSAGDQIGEPQRYGEYKEQFTDYNYPEGETADNGDENGDGSARGDNDDRNLGDGPGLDPSFTGTSELYLYERLTNERTYLRWVIRPDPNAPPGAMCDSNGVGSGCIGNIQMLRLVGKDIGLNHDENAPGAFDGLIDTWVCHPNWESSCSFSIDNDRYKIPGNQDDGWVNIFPDGVDVRDAQFFIEPMKTLRLAYGMDPNEIVHPYVRMQIRIGYGWAKRSVLHNIDPEISVSTTVSLTNYIITLDDSPQ